MRSCAALIVLVGFATPAAAQSTTTDPPAERGGSARVIWGPSGRLLAPGQATVTTYQLFMVPVVHVGVTSRFQLGVGAPIYRGVLLAPKVQVFQRDGVAVAAGVSHAWMPGIGGGGYGYVASTFGTNEASVTVTGGAVYDVDGRTQPVLSVGAERRLSPRVIWITENYVTGGGVMTAGGFRIAGPNKAVDLVMGWLINEHGVAPLPMLNIAWKY
jgi:hypothetical protein